MTAAPHSIQPGTEPVKCIGCGRFVGLPEMENQTAKFYFEPDNHYGPERCEWTCARCAAQEAT